MSFSNRSFRISFIVGFLFCSIAIGLLLAGMANLGLAMFLFLPLTVGISSGMLPNLRQGIYGTLASLGIISILLIATMIEGVICVIMALPIILLASWLGWVVGNHVRKDDDDSTLKTSLAPFLLFIVANMLELFIGNPFVKAEVSSTVLIDGTTEEVYNAIIHVDTVDVETNLLQKIGLPTPRKCILTEEKVGGLRLCEFEEGRIVETIREIRKNEYLRMEVTECDLGRERHWLQFHEDIYNIEKTTDDKTKITRTTTYSSNLKPRFYWKAVEKIAIASEQDFVFRNLIKDVGQHSLGVH